MYNVINMINIAVCYMKNLKEYILSSNKENAFLFNFLSVGDDEYSLYLYIS